MAFRDLREFIDELDRRGELRRIAAPVSRDLEITVILHENRSLKGALRKKINLRKREYIHYIENLIAQVQEQAGVKPLLTPSLAAFALLGMINWLYQWFQPEGPTKQNELTEAYVDFFFRGLMPSARPA